MFVLNVVVCLPPLLMLSKVCLQFVSFRTSESLWCSLISSSDSALIFVYVQSTEWFSSTWDLESSWCLIRRWICITVLGNQKLSLNQEMKPLPRSCSHRPQFFQNNNHLGQRCAEVRCLAGIAGLAEVPNVLAAMPATQWVLLLCERRGRFIYIATNWSFAL